MNSEKNEAEILVISHNYQTGAVQAISDHVMGTSGVVRHAREFNGKKVIFCGVLYMAEDLYAAADTVRVFIPEITVRNGEIIKPRCPMIAYQGNSEIITMEHVKAARALEPDLVLSYINTPLSIKAATDGVYNGTTALRTIRKIAEENHGKGRVVFLGDVNVNQWIAESVRPEYPEFEVISMPENVYCPPHVTIDTAEFIFKYQELTEKYGEEKVGLELHAEVNPVLRDFGFDNNAYFGGTDGLVKKPLNSSKRIWLIGTVEGVVDRLRSLDTTREYCSPRAVCPNMAYTSPAKVEKAKEILKKSGPVATIRYKHRDRPYYEIEIHQPELVTPRNGATRIPAVELTIDPEIKEEGRKALQTLLE